MVKSPKTSHPGTPRCEPLLGARRALCVGIDAYRRRPLAGARADATAWAGALRQLGFTSTVLLADRAATRSAILGALTELVTKSTPGDAVVFQYAGHGTLVVDRDRDEANETISPGQDEAICPVDFYEGGLIVDDEIGRIFDLTPPGVSVTCFFDCCHAGSMTREAEAGRTTPRRLTLRPSEVARYRARVAGAPGGAASAARAVREAPEVGFFACRSDEIAWETEGRGDFTRRALDALAATGGRATNSELLDAIRSRFGTTARQTPVMVCAPALCNAPLFTAAA